MKILSLGFILACASLASADEVRLKGGGKVSGVVEELGDKVVVHMEHGNLTFPRDQVEQIDRAKMSVLQEYQQRLQTVDLTRIDQIEGLLKWVDQRKMGNVGRDLRERLGKLRWEGLDQTNASQLEIYATWAQSNGLAEMAKAALKRALTLRHEKLDGAAPNAEALYQLGLWAKTNNLPADALVLFQEAINVNPDHEFARRALGYQFYSGKWRTPIEVKIAMGLIEFEGDWMTPQAKEAILSSRTLEKERRLLDEARRRLEEERAISRIEFERRRAELDARAREIAQRLAELEFARANFRAYDPVPVPIPVPVPVTPLPPPPVAPQPPGRPPVPHPR